MNKDFKEFLMGIKTATRREMVYTREDLSENRVLIHVIDVETGVELDSYWARKNDKGDLVLSRGNKGKKTNYTGGQKPFTKVYQHSINEFLTSDEFGTLAERKNQAFILLFLMEYADRGTGKIHKRKKDDDRLTQTDIAELTGLSKATVHRAIKSMLEHGLLKIIDDYYHLVWKYAGRD
jgi:hypothetical protein